MKTLGYYAPEEEEGQYSDIDVYNTLKKAIRDFEKEKYLLVKPPYVRYIYWCNKCGWFVIDYANEYDIRHGCGHCGGKLQYANKKFIRHTSRLLKKYRIRVKHVLSKLYEIFGYFSDYVIDEYSTLYLEVYNESIGLVDIWIYPHRHNKKFTMYIHIVIYRLNESKLDIVEKLENLYCRYGLNGYLWIMNTPKRLESLTQKGYRESIWSNSYSYSKNMISKYLI